MRLLGLMILMVLILGPIAESRLLQDNNLPAFLNRIRVNFLQDPYFQYIMLVIAMWILGYCVFVAGISRTDLFRGTGAMNVNKQGKILAATLAAFLPGTFIFAVKGEQKVTAQIAIVLQPVALVIGIIIGVLSFWLLYEVFKRFDFTNSASSTTPATNPAPAPSTPPRNP